MTQAEHRHDRLAVRLSLIISRLVAGETLYVRKLAAEFGVSVRTLRRDFRERLMYLDLDYQSGYCRLRAGVSGAQGELDVLTFAHRTGQASPSASLSFYRLIKAITACQRVTLLADGERYERLAPYRLVATDGSWYLIAEYHGHPVVFTLNEIHVIQPTTEIFIRNRQLYRLVEDIDFIRALPHFRFIQQSLNSLSLP